MKQSFLNEENLFKCLKDLFSGRDDSGIIDDDFIKEYASEICRSIMRDMDKYVHMRDKAISGNLMQINLNWQWGHKNDPRSFEDIVKCMDAGVIDEEELAHIQEWTQNWFFESHGTFGLTYNFDEVCSEMLYEYEQEEDLD